MQIRHLLLILIFWQPLDAMTQERWSWLSGDKSFNVQRVYGTRGVPDAANTPGGRIGAASWTDGQGNLWLFGGEGNGGLVANGVLADLWRYDVQANLWTWMGGSSELNSYGLFVEEKQAAPQNNPGGRHNPVTWKDNAGNFWLFGGRGLPSRKQGDDDDDLEPAGMLNDLWMLSPATGQWTFVGGSPEVNDDGRYGTLREPDNDNFPGARYSASGWKDNNGRLWLFGGRGYAESDDEVVLLDDMWMYDIAGDRWTWMAGSSEGEAQPQYGDRGTASPSNSPGGRLGGTSWTDNNGDFFLYGGGTLTTLFGDLWKFDQASNTWAWINGTTQRNTQPDVDGASPHPGSRTLSAVWLDGAGDIWLFGGNGFGGIGGSNPLNDLWKYSTSQNTWTQIRQGDGSPVYGTQGAPDDANTPGGTGNGTFWQGADGQFLLFGGRTTGIDYLNQVWALTIGCSETIEGVRYTDLTVDENVPFNLSARASGIKYSWTPTEGVAYPSLATTSAITNVDRQYLVEITTPQGCVIVDTQLVKIKKADTTGNNNNNNPRKIAVPTAFTPDANNVNDRLRPLGNIGRLEYFRIFNRWGNLVFQTSEIGEGWDGRFKGVDQPMDTYMWILSAYLPNGQPVKSSGKTVLIR